jgi:YidC/Oxa1 family membrane protein insertase
MFGDLFARLEQVLGSVLSWYFDLLTPALSDGMALGLSIIMLTITINLVVFPLTLKQTRATRAFTEIQPKIKKIQAEFKDDPQEMQRRLMAAQKEAGATPGGCLLPLLVQMPIWFALFRMLRTPFVFVIDPTTKLPTTELVAGAIHPIHPDSALGISLLNGEPNKFLGMMLNTSPAQAIQQGLKEAIPYLLMMVLMVATQYVQQWHSTYGQDRPDQKGAGAQQAITRIMPLFIGFISYNFPAGLVLYWSTSYLFRLGQQALIFKIDGRPTPPGGTTKDPKQDPDSTVADPKKPQPGASDKRRRRKRR